jgi:hypothetical protein
MCADKQSGEEKEREGAIRRKRNEIPWLKDKLATDSNIYNDNNQGTTLTYL